MYAEFRWQQRMPCKNVNFGIVYEITAPGLATLIATSGGDQEYWTEKRCEGVISKWYGIYPEVMDGSKLQTQRARRFGMTWDPFGRVRMVPEVRSVHPWIVSQGIRQCANMHIQAFAAGILKLAMAEIFDGWRDLGWYQHIGILMQIHDELLFEGERPAMEDFLEWCGGIVTNCCPMKVPIKYGIAISEESWGMLQK
jgi:DNA polymerase-1